ncbi:hypothetical protein BOTBODRAFT_40652 [Botryobasidium botryosum FD-172 SS1]|uniref:Uncharacterized protein n=1 Tax=Botryobasidium botryosum (strain FD-172 SS1) TaxID=930990 RepID=A0A067N9N1_BOTB1|nr:hypothetical protein BOTBODRAFT_40652 [Botryobasidium botryosum FD-172 SS1]
MAASSPSSSHPPPDSAMASTLPRPSFSFAHSAYPTQCGNFTLTWSGGEPPFQLLITPMFQTPRNLSIPRSAYSRSNRTGSYTFPLPLAYQNGQNRFLLTMSDKTGLASGGTSEVLTVERTSSSNANVTCGDLSPPTPFLFNTPQRPSQCQPFRVGRYTNATKPVTLIGLIPLGETFTISPKGNASYLSWNPLNVEAGIQFTLLMRDAEGRLGAATDLLPVLSGDPSCLDASSPTSITVSPTIYPSPHHHRSMTDNAALIGGAVAGGVVFLILLATLVAFFIRRRRIHAAVVRRMPSFRARPTRQKEPLDLLSTTENNPSARGLDNAAPPRVQPVPYLLPPSRATTMLRSPTDTELTSPTTATEESQQFFFHHGPPALPPPSYPGLAVVTSKSALTAAPPTSISPAPGLSPVGSSRGIARYVVHTDGGAAPEDMAHDQEEEEVVELPPNYQSLGPATRRAFLQNQLQLETQPRPRLQSQSRPRSHERSYTLASTSASATTASASASAAELPTLSSDDIPHTQYIGHAL